MKLCLRWYGPDDPVSLGYIRQIPGAEGVVGALFDIPVGDVWPRARIRELRLLVEEAGLKLLGIESVPVHEEIKLGHESRELYLAAFAQTLRNLGEEGVPVVCYNFMPVFDWLRTDLALTLPDGSTCLGYDRGAARGIDPLALGGVDMPAWAGDFSPQRLKELFSAYQGLTQEDLWNNLKYFLQYLVPVAEEAGVRLALHPDDPPWPIFGLPRIITGAESLAWVLDLVDSPANGLALCSGSLGADPANDLPGMIRRFGSRIHFAHVRNVRHTGEGSFHETAHPSACGDLDMYEIMKAYYETGFKGILRPDHGRMIWNEQGRPGYGLYDRALGATYILGLWEAISRSSQGD